MIRAFVSVEIPTEAADALAQAQEKLRAAAGRLPVKWTNPTGIHLTLRFLGDVRETLAGPLGDALRAACAPIAQFELGLGALGCFPDPARARVIWAGLAGNLAALEGLRVAIVGATDGFVQKREDKPFVPHLTLGRVGDARRRELDGLAAAIASVSLDPVRWRVQSARLMKSILRPQGAEHTVLAECPLLGMQRGSV